MLFQMVIPVLTVVSLLGIGLYLFVLRSVSHFADEQIQKELSGFASQIHSICDESFTELLEAGNLENQKAIIIKKALAIGQIEKYAEKCNIGYRVVDAEKNKLLHHKIDTDLLDFIRKNHSTAPYSKFQFERQTYYFQHFTFKPWEWHIGLVRDRETFAPLIRRVKLIYIITGSLLICSLVLLLIIQDRFLRRPSSHIIRAIQSGNPPTYKGISEFEFLSDNISRMMASLEEKNKWMKDLYHIAITNRGEEFFKLVTDTLSKALELDVLVLAYNQKKNNFRSIAFSQTNPHNKAVCKTVPDLPGLQIIADKKPLVISKNAYLQFPSFLHLTEIKADSYVRMPILNREGVTIGTMNLFGKQREFRKWDLHLIETVCQIVAVEFEYLEKERDKNKLEIQLQRSKKMEAIGLLAGGVAHDLNNILAGIIAYPELLLLKLPEDSKLRAPIEQIQISGNRAAAVVSDLLTVARGVATIREPHNLNIIVQEYLDSPEFEALRTSNQKITYDTHIQAESPIILCSPVHIKKILMNLVTNAAEAIDSAGSVFITTTNHFIEKSAGIELDLEAGHYLLLEIRDTGSGIPSKDLDHIFEPFYSKKVMGKSGTGLGLTIVWNVVQDHQGSILAESDQQGTSFKIWLPVTEETSIAPENKEQKSEFSGNKEHILVVDDEPQLRDIASKMLRTLNYRVDSVSSGELALDFIFNNPVDLVLIDMLMVPGMNGRQTYEKMIKIRPDQKVIIISGFSKSSDVREALKLGARGFIQKPYTMEKLGRAVKKALRRK